MHAVKKVHACDGGEPTWGQLNLVRNIAAKAIGAMAASIALACGGQTSNSNNDSSSASGGVAGAASGGVAGTASGGVAGAAGLQCPAFKFGFTPSNHDPVETDSGVRVEPLQVPMFERGGWYDGPRSPDPATWDRSALPKGACVYRLHGVSADCYPLGGFLWSGSCEAVSAHSQVPLLFSFYEIHRCDGVSPGCPSSEPKADAPGNWWYLVGVGPMESDLVICAPECTSAFAQGEACLDLSDSREGCQ
jgi:hypothetical protein